MGGGKKVKQEDTGRKSVLDKYEQSGRKSKIPAAYPVTMLVDLQVYMVPREKWVLSRRLYRHNIVEEGVSLGFVRVLPQLTVHNLRRELQIQLGHDIIPRDFIFVRSVGNIFIQLKPKQELELKVKNFIPPFSTEPEIYLLEVLPQEDTRMLSLSLSPLPMLLREDTPPHICHDLCHHSRARKKILWFKMNITIIIPAIQVPKKEALDSPQPTTPFPPVSISPSPFPVYSFTSSTSSSYSNITQLCSECNSSLQNNIKINHEVSNEANKTEEKNQVPNKNLSNEILSTVSELTSELNTPTPLEDFEITVNHESTTRHPPLKKMSSVDQQDFESFEARTTESASSPETVINLSTINKNEKEIEILTQGYEEEQVQIPSKVAQTLYEHLGEPVPIIRELLPTPTPTPSPDSIFKNEVTEEQLGLDDDPAEELISDSLLLNFKDEDGMSDSASSNYRTEDLNPDSISINPEEEYPNDFESVTSNENLISNPVKDTTTDTTLAEGNGKKVKVRRKLRTYPDPRKPSNFPQRLNKLTLTRQALAREKRRVYVEERIQQYMRNAQRMLSYRSPPKSLAAQSDKSDDSLTTPTTGDPLLEDRTQILTSAQSLPNIIDQNHSFLISPIPVARVHTKKYKNSLNFSFSPCSATSLPIIPLPQILFQTNDSGGSQVYSADTIPEQETQLWKGIEHQGYFYSFRVRQNGPVQMLNKGVQTAGAEIDYNGNDSIKTPIPSKKQEVPYATHTIHSSTTSVVRIPIQDDSKSNKNITLARDKILREITETVQLRHDAELRRAELIQRANDLQTRVKEKREKINRRHEFWHKKYIEESSLTRPLEGACTSLRGELNNVHRRLLAHLEGRDLPLRLRDGPSKKANYKIMAARLQHEIKELQQKVKAAKLRLESETKLKEQAERETRDIRNDLSHKKVVMSLARSQNATLPAVHPRTYDALVY